MATQKRFINYKAQTESFPLGERYVGVLKPGRYNGFDVMETSDNITLSIGHSGRIIKGTPDGNGMDDYGVLMTPTGLIIHEEGPIIVNLPPNSPPAGGLHAVRTFAVICEHNYQPIQGGVPASYFIIQNPEFGPEPPVLPNPAKQIIIGIITKDYSKNTLTYVKKQAPILSDRTAQELYKIIEPHIIFPEPEELPDFQKIIADTIKLNQPKIIMTGPFDIASSESAGNWTTIPYAEYPSQNAGHNIEGHTIKFKQTRIGSGNAWLDIEIATVTTNVNDPIFEWDTINLLAITPVNDPDQGAKTFPILEIRKNDVSGSIFGSSVRRFQILEADSAAQAIGFRLVVQNKYILKPVSDTGSNELDLGDFDIIM